MVERGGLVVRGRVEGWNWGWGHDGSGCRWVLVAVLSGFETVSESDWLVSGLISVVQCERGRIGLGHSAHLV